MLTVEDKAKIQVWIDKFPTRQAALIMALRVVQDREGYLSDEMIDAVADHLEIPKVMAYEVVSFYNVYRKEKLGKHYLKVCSGLSCCLAGSEDIIRYVEKGLRTRVSQKNPKGVYLDKTECLGACDRAPVAIIDDQTYVEQMDQKVVDQLIQDLKERCDE